MQPLKLSIEGNYWDSQIYAGRLYLFTDDGSVRTLNWDRIIGEWKIEPRLRLALECAFRRSDYLYSSEFSLLLQDDEIKRTVLDKFEGLRQKELALNIDSFAENVAEQDSPFPFPHSDSLIYQSRMYVGASSGLYRATCDKRTVKPISKKTERWWDGPAISIAASYGEVAVAAGDFGLFEVPLTPIWNKGVRPTIDFPCNKCSWNFQSIYCTSSDSLAGCLADFEKVRADGDMFRSRRFAKELYSEDIFGESGFTWSRQEKIYLAGNDGLRVARYIPWEEKERRLLRMPDLIPFRAQGKVLAGAVANFGTVLEFENSLTVLLSDGEEIWIGGDPIAWRIFPRSKHYENQLHVIFDDHIDLFSFNHDYFVDQGSKLLGTSNFQFGRKRSQTLWSSTGRFEPDELEDDDPEADDIDWNDVLDDDL
jgi:hypothetical protein